MEVLQVLTKKTIKEFKEEGGIGWWRTAASRARECEFIICTRNFPNNKSQHGNAFLIGRITGVAESAAPDKSGRYRRLIQISEYAILDIPNVWVPQRSPFKYITKDQLNINFEQLVWQIF